MHPEITFHTYSCGCYVLKMISHTDGPGNMYRVRFISERPVRYGRRLIESNQFVSSVLTCIEIYFFTPVLGYRHTNRDLFPSTVSLFYSPAVQHLLLYQKLICVVCSSYNCVMTFPKICSNKMAAILQNGRH
jgi:hypothetical protein